MSVVFAAGAAALAATALAQSQAPLLMAGIFLAGAAWIGGQAVMVLLVSESYPAEIRATCVGWTLTIGRISAIASPAIVALPLSWGWHPGQILLIPVLPALLSAVAVLYTMPNPLGSTSPGGNGQRGPAMKASSVSTLTSVRPTVREVVFDLLRELKMTTIFCLDSQRLRPRSGRARTKQEIQEAFSKAFNAHGPTLIVVPIKHQIRPIVSLVAEGA